MRSKSRRENSKKISGLPEPGVGPASNLEVNEGMAGLNIWLVIAIDYPVGMTALRGAVGALGRTMTGRRMPRVRLIPSGDRVFDTPPIRDHYPLSPSTTGYFWRLCEAFLLAGTRRKEDRIPPPLFPGPPVVKTATHPGEKSGCPGIYSPERSALHSVVAYGETSTSSIVFDASFPTIFTE